MPRSHTNNQPLVDWPHLPTHYATSTTTHSYDIGATALVLVALQDVNTAGVSWGQDLAASTLLRGLFASSVVGGALLGTLVVLFGAADALGRRRELLVGALLYLVGGLLEFVSGFPSWGRRGGLVLALVSRWIYGCGIGFSMHAAPAYIAEMSPPSLRGFLVALKEAAIVLGTSVCVCGFVFGMDGGRESLIKLISYSYSSPTPQLFFHPLSM